MAISTKKITYTDNTPILVDYATNDSQGNNITTEYLHVKDLSINSVEDATATLKTLTLGGVTYLVNSQDEPLDGTPSILVGGNYSTIPTERNFNFGYSGGLGFTRDLPADDPLADALRTQGIYKGVGVESNGTPGKEYALYQWFGNESSPEGILYDKLNESLSSKTNMYIAYEFYIYSKIGLFPPDNSERNVLGGAIVYKQKTTSLQVSLLATMVTSEQVNEHVKHYRFYFNLNNIVQPESILYGFFGSAILAQYNTTGINSWDILATGLKLAFFNTEHEAQTENIIGDWVDVSTRYVSVSDVNNMINESVASNAMIKPWNNKNYNRARLSRFFMKYTNKIVDDYNQLTITMAGDSIFGRIEDPTRISTYYNAGTGTFNEGFPNELEFTPDMNEGSDNGFNTGHFPPNMWEQTVPFKILKALQYNDADVKYFNHKAAEVTKSGTWVSAFPAGADNINTLYTTTANSYIELTIPTGSKFAKFIYSDYGSSSNGAVIQVSFSLNNAAFTTDLTSLGITCNKTLSSGQYTCGSYKWGNLCFKGLNPANSYKIRITFISGTKLSVWGFETWSNPRINVVVTAQGGTIAANHAAGLQEGFYSAEYNNSLCIYELPFTNDFGTGIITNFVGTINSLDMAAPAGQPNGTFYYSAVTGHLTNFNLDVIEGEYVEFDGTSWKIGSTQVQNALNNYRTNESKVYEALKGYEKTSDLDILCVVPHISNFTLSRPFMTQEAMSLIKSLCSSNSFAAIDITTYLAYTNSIDDSYTVDQIHLNNKGVGIYESLLLDVLQLKSFDNYPLLTDYPVATAMNSYSRDDSKYTISVSGDTLTIKENY